MATNRNTEVGIVVGVITTENTPTENLYIKLGRERGIGTVFYIPYRSGFNQDDLTNSQYLIRSKPAMPLFSGIQDYPLIGETILVIDGLPSPISQTASPISQKYYISTINVWNNIQQNALNTNTLGNTFVEDPGIRPLLSFEGDRIFQGRKGNSLRFGSTVKFRSNINKWSTIGNDGDPITILTNGYESRNENLNPIVEDINNDKSSIYLTTSQKIPLKPGAIIKNSVSSPVLVDTYNNPQIILNSDRVVLNAKNDSVIINSKDFIELNSDNVISLNSKSWIHFDSTKVLLGNNRGKVPSEPVLLGDQTATFLLEILDSLSNLAGSLSSSVSTAEGTPLINVNNAGEQLFNDILSLKDKLNNIKSQIVFTS